MHNVVEKTKKLTHFGSYLMIIQVLNDLLFYVYLRNNTILGICGKTLPPPPLTATTCWKTPFYLWKIWLTQGHLLIFLELIPLIEISVIYNLKNEMFFELAS